MINPKLPLVSIGIPTYNRPQGLRKALICITEQTYTNLEIIISDNCSTDPEVEKVVNEFISDKRIKYIRQKINIGPIKNFSFVLEQATGDYFKWNADDDWVDSNFVESCVTFLINNEDYVGAYGVAKIIDTNGEYLYTDRIISFDDEDGAQRVKRYLDCVQYNGSFYGLFPKNYFEYLKANENLADDWLIVSRIAFLGKYKMIENSNYYLTTGGMSNNIDSMIKNFNLCYYTKYFFYLAIGINLMKDIAWKSKAYHKLSFFKRFKLAKESFLIIYKRFNVGEEVKTGIKKIFKIKYPKISKNLLMVKGFNKKYGL